MSTEQQLIELIQINKEKYYRLSFTYVKNKEDALDIVKGKDPQHRIIFLRSWNEWAEGNYMEPDLKFGHGYLDALREVIEE